jgi:hypothetical protein
MVEPWRLGRRKLLARLSESDRRIDALEDEREAFGRQEIGEGDYAAHQAHYQGMRHRREAIERAVSDRKSLARQLSWDGLCPAEPVRRVRERVAFYHDQFNMSSPPEFMRRGLRNPTLNAIEEKLNEMRRITLREDEDIEPDLVAFAAETVAWLEKSWTEAKEMAQPRPAPRRMTEAERESLLAEEAFWELQRARGVHPGPHPRKLAAEAGYAI